MGNGQLSRATGLPPSTVSRLTDSLVQLGYLRVNPDSGAYVLTPKNLRLGYPVLANLPVAARAQKTLDQLTDTTGLTSALAVRDDLHVVFVVVARARKATAVNLAVGGRLPISVSAAGIAFLRAMSEPDKSRVTTTIRNDLVRRGQPTDEFDARLADRYNSYLASFGGWHSDVGGVATAIRSGGELYSLTLIARTADVSSEDIEGRLVPALLTAAEQLSD